MSIDRAEVAKIEILKDTPRYERSFDRFFNTTGCLVHEPTHTGNLLDQALRLMSHGVVDLPRNNTVKVLGNGADIRRNRHFIVVEDDDEFIFVQGARVTHRLPCHTGGQRAVADDHHHVIVSTQLIARFRNAETGGNRGAGMAGIEDVVRTFLAAAKTTNALVLAYGVKTVMATSQQFVRIGLVPDIPDNLVTR